MQMIKKSYYKILQLIYHSPGIRLNELIRKSNVSVATAKTILDELLESNIIKEEIIRGEKKAILRNFYPSLNSEEAEMVFSMIEIEKKDAFLRKHKNLIGPLKGLVEQIKDAETILIFGSFASFSETDDSDLDILLIMKKNFDKGKVKKIMERSFITYNGEVSPRLTNIKKLKENKSFLESIKINHIIIKGYLNFLKI